MTAAELQRPVASRGSPKRRSRQLAGPGKVKVFSSGSALQGGPAMYLAPADHSPIVAFSEMASFTPFDGGAVVTVATHEHDARRRPAGELRLGEGQDRSGGKVPVGQVLRRERPICWSRSSAPVSAAGSQPNVLGGD